MHGSGKSDSRTVPGKVPNKARKLAAEGPEGRRLAKQNSPQSTTLRTQGRERVHEALGRVRQAAERMHARLKEVKAELRRRWHDPVPEVGQWLGSVVRGYTQYHGIAGNSRAITRFRTEVGHLWHRALKRRSQKSHVTWVHMERLIGRYLPPAHVVHPWPSETFAVMMQGKSPVR